MSTTITIPNLALVVLIGPSGAGKSSFAARHFAPSEVLSSDFCRLLVADDENDAVDRCADQRGPPPGVDLQSPLRIEVADMTFRLYDSPVSRTTLRAKGQLTLPEEIRAGARLEEGDLLEAEITEEGILLRPQKVIDATQAWFWTREWQQGEREADADLVAGRGETFNSDEEFLDALRVRAKPAARRRKR